MRWFGVLGIVGLWLLCSGFEWEGRLGRLQRDFESGDAARRREVVRLLSSYSAREVGGAVLRALDDPDPGVRVEAAEAAGRVRLHQAVPRLLEWLEEENADVRTSAVRALGRIRDARTVTPLVRALGDANTDVRRAAVQALARIGTPEVVVPLLGRLDDVSAPVRIDAAELLGSLGDPRAVVPLVGRARDDAPEVRTAVYAALGELADRRGLAALLIGLRDPVEDAQLTAIGALGRLGDASAVAPLRDVLDDPDPRRARAVVAALGAIEDERAVAAVMDALAQPRTQALAADALITRARRLGRAAPDARDAFVLELAQAVADAVPAQRAISIARVVATIQAPKPVPTAAPALLAAVEGVRGTSPELLDALAATSAPEALLPILSRLRTDDEAALEASLSALERYFVHAAADGRAADPLLSALGRVPSRMRARVVRLLGTVRARRALAELRPLLDHPDSELRRATVQAIGAIGDPDGAAALLPLLRDRDGRTRFEAARALGAAGGADTARALAMQLADLRPTDRHAVMEGLGSMLGRLERTDALPAATAELAARNLAAAARDDDRELAARAIDTLGRWGSPLAIPLLSELLAHPSAARRRAAAQALGGIDDDASRAALRAALESDESPLRATAATALGSVGAAEDVERIIAFARTARWPARAAAAFALARLSRRGVAPAEPTAAALCALAENRGPYVRANVATGLAALGAGPCPDGPSPTLWLENRRAAPVQVAAARWLAAAAAAGTVDVDDARRTLDTCVDRALADEVAEACAAPELPALDDEADVYAWSADGRTLLRDRLVALRLADGSVMLARTDDNGHVRLPLAPRGRLALDDPAATPLEPASRAD